MKNFQKYLPLYLLGLVLAAVAVYYFFFRDKVDASAVDAEDANTYKKLNAAAPNLGPWFYETVLARYKSQDVADSYKGSKSGAFMAVIDSAQSALKINGKDPITDAKHEELWAIYNNYRAIKSSKSLETV